MKNRMLLFLFFGVWALTAQETEDKAVQKTIETFFEGFHNQDSVLIRSTVAEGIRMQTIGKSKNGSDSVRNQNFNKFIRSIVSIPDTTRFQERLLSFNIQIDGPMANAWTPYEFWVNDEFSHCGVNSFQLFKDKGEWKIIYIIDTRRKEGCL
jgi:hypothetical protein